MSYARAEAAWLEGDVARARRGSARARRYASRFEKNRGGEERARSGRGRVGTTVLCPRTRRSRTHSINGRYTEAAAAWRAIGCPYEKRSRSPTVQPRRTFAQRSGCSADSARSRWHDESRPPPRNSARPGSRVALAPQRQANPAGRADREVDVLRQLTQGCRTPTSQRHSCFAEDRRSPRVVDPSQAARPESRRSGRGGRCVAQRWGERATEDRDRARLLLRAPAFYGPSVDGIYRTLGRDREAELLREAERLHRGARLRRQVEAGRRDGLSLRALIVGAWTRVRHTRRATLELR